MARNALPIANPTRDGVAIPTEQAGDATNGHVVTNTGKTLIFVRNADASNPHSVTFVTPGTVDGQAIGDRTVSIAISTTRVFSEFATNVYGRTMAINVDSTQLKLYALEP